MHIRQHTSRAHSASILMLSGKLVKLYKGTFGTRQASPLSRQRTVMANSILVESPTSKNLRELSDILKDILSSVESISIKLRGIYLGSL